MLKIIQITTDNREHFKDYVSEVPYFGTAPQALIEGFSLLEDVEIHVLGCTRKKLKSPEKIAHNVHFHSLLVPKIGWMSSGYHGCTKAVREVCAEIKPDIVHGQGSERECAITAVRSGFPNVITIHGNVKELHRLKMFGTGLYGPMASFLETHTMKRTSGVFCNSAYTETLVSPRARHTWRVPNPIRSEFFKPKKPNQQYDIPTLVNVGVVGPRKRQLEILRVVSEIVKQGYQIKIVFAGTYSETNEYGSKFAEEMRKAISSGYAEFAGFLDTNSLIDLMDHSHGFIHFPTEEAFGLVVAEAMSRGLKFFGANLGGIRDIANGIEGSELHDDFESLKHGIIRWLRDGAPPPENSVDIIYSRYHPRAIAERHIQIYNEVISKTSP
jgi:glycosyltransferase involved in cell wall biosynthesis